MNFNNKTEMKNNLPGYLLPKVTILLQDSGYVTISPNKFTKQDWSIFNERVKQMGGRWIPDGAHSHWSIPWSK